MDNIASPADAHAMLAGWKERAEKQFADAKAASEAVQAVTATGMDDNEMVAVTLNSAGAVTNVQFGPAFGRMQPRHAERQFMQAYQNAGAALMRAAQAAVAERLPASSPTSKALIDSIKMRFPDEEEEA
jgi:DNA-binding protein YbaB